MSAERASSWKKNSSFFKLINMIIINNNKYSINKELKLRQKQRRFDHESFPWFCWSQHLLNIYNFYMEKRLCNILWTTNIDFIELILESSYKVLLNTVKTVILRRPTYFLQEAECSTIFNLQFYLQSIITSLWQYNYINVLSHPM